MKSAFRVPFRGKAATAGALVALALMTGVPAALAGVAQDEANTAAEHANYAAQADAIGMVHAHLHHAVNCLVGPDGIEFDVKAANPCASMGKGAIPDAKTDKFREKLVAAVRLALDGIETDNIDEAKAAATKLHAKLKQAAMAM